MKNLTENAFKLGLDALNKGIEAAKNPELQKAATSGLAGGAASSAVQAGLDTLMKPKNLGKVAATGAALGGAAGLAGAVGNRVGNIGKKKER